MNILGISGSLRRESLNTRLLKAAARLAPAGMHIEIFDGIGAIPLFDGDLLAAGLPPPVEALRDAVRAADGVLFASPEYNFSITGVLKNAIDWASRDADQPFNGKPCAIMSASQGPFGGARSQYDLRKVVVYLNAHVLNRPEVLIGNAQTRFDAAGVLVDESTRAAISAQLQAFAEHVAWVQKASAA